MTSFRWPPAPSGGGSSGGGGGGGASDASDLGDGRITNAEFYNLDGSTSNLQAQINARATQTALNALSTTVADKADQSAVDAKADQTALDALSTTVGTKADQSAVDAKADQTDLNSLTGVVSTKADQTALTELTTRVAAVEPGILTFGNTGATPSVDLSQAPVISLTLDANATLSLSGAVPGARYYLLVDQDATGSRLVTWPGTFVWSGGSAPTLSTDPSARDVIELLFDGTNYFASVFGAGTASEGGGGGGGGGPLDEFTISGIQSGTLALGDYTVEGDILVEEGSSLVLTAGSIFRNENNVLWEIQGTLTADGTSSDRITLTKTDAATRWHGIRFCKEDTQTTASVTFDTAANTISTSFGLNENWPIKFTTTGTLPAELNVDQRYYLLSGNRLALRMGGPEIDLTDAGSGTHTAHRLFPNSSSVLSADKDLPNSITYCDFVDADRSALFNFDFAYRHWLRGGALSIHQLEDFTLNNCTFTRCGAEDRGGAIYIQGSTSPDGFDTHTYTNLEFVDCFVLDEMGAALAQSHGNQGTSLLDCSFSGSSAPAYQDLTLTVDDSTDVVTIGFPGSYPMQDGFIVQNLQTSGTLPGGLSAGTAYYAVNASGETCQLALTPGGTPINITDTGSGSHTCDSGHNFFVFDSNLTVSGLTFP